MVTKPFKLLVAPEALIDDELLWMLCVMFIPPVLMVALLLVVVAPDLTMLPLVVVVLSVFREIFFAFSCVLDCAYVKVHVQARIEAMSIFFISCRPLR